MIHTNGQFTGARGLSVYFQYWQPEGAARAVIIIAHGAAEHGGRYDIFADYFTRQGYLVAALDHIGHGRSEGDRCVVKGLSDYTDTLDLFRQQVVADYPQLPLVLLGHSMGGLITTNYLLDQQEHFAGCVLSGPAIKTELEPPWIQLLLIRFFAKVLPKLGVLQLDASGVSRVPEEVERYVNDPLNYTGKMTASMVAALFAGMGNIQAKAGDIRLPLLLLHGGADTMTSPEGSRFLNDQVSSSDKTLHIYPGLYHEVFNEPERDDIFATIGQWLDARLPPNTQENYA